MAKNFYEVTELKKQYEFLKDIKPVSLVNSQAMKGSTIYLLHFGNKNVIKPLLEAGGERYVQKIVLCFKNFSLNEAMLEKAKEDFVEYNSWAGRIKKLSDDLEAYYTMAKDYDKIEADIIELLASPVTKPELPKLIKTNTLTTDEYKKFLNILLNEF